MPWSAPSLTDVRGNNAAYIAGKLQVPTLPNGEVRVLADANAGNAHLNLQYLDWQSDQDLPDTAEKEFLDRHGTIWLVDEDGSRDRKAATFASGSADRATASCRTFERPEAAGPSPERTRVTYLM